jgi:hypothetical protein
MHTCHPSFRLEDILAHDESRIYPIQSRYRRSFYYKRFRFSIANCSEAFDQRHIIESNSSYAWVQNAIRKYNPNLIFGLDFTIGVSINSFNCLDRD